MGSGKFEVSFGVQQNSWGAIDDGDDSDSTMSSSSFHGSVDSGESSSFDVADDASSAFSSSETLDSSPSLSPQLSKGPLYELSDLMAQLPIKRGLSIHFHGKSQSFTSLSNVRCVEDLAKKENPCRKKMKSCKSYAGLDGTNHTNKSLTPKACSRAISKRVSRGGSLLPSLSKNSLNNSPRSPFSLQDEF